MDCRRLGSDQHIDQLARREIDCEISDRAKDLALPVVHFKVQKLRRLLSTFQRARGIKIREGRCSRGRLPDLRQRLNSRLAGLSDRCAALPRIGLSKERVVEWKC